MIFPQNCVIIYNLRYMIYQGCFFCLNGKCLPSLSPWGPLSIWGEPGMWGGAHILGTLLDEWRRTLVLGHLSVMDSMKRTLREGFFTGEPERWGFWEICKMLCKWASLFLGALLGNLEGVRFPGLLREKKSISGFLSWTWMPLRF